MQANLLTITPKNKMEVLTLSAPKMLSAFAKHYWEICEIYLLFIEKKNTRSEKEKQTQTIIK